MSRIFLRSLATRAVLLAGMVGVLAAPPSALAHGRDRQDWRRPAPVYVAPPAPAYAAPYPAPYAAPANPAPIAYQSCNNALVGGLIGAAAGTLIGAGAGSHSRDGGAAAIMGLIGGAAVGTAVGAASCD
jgi:hypothetical protein